MCPDLSLGDYENEEIFNPNVEVKRGTFGELVKFSDTDTDTCL